MVLPESVNVIQDFMTMDHQQLAWNVIIHVKNVKVPYLLIALSVQIKIWPSDRTTPVFLVIADALQDIMMSVPIPVASVISAVQVV